jgi:hypothetical protein
LVRLAYMMETCSSVTSVALPEYWWYSARIEAIAA